MVELREADAGLLPRCGSSGSVRLRGEGSVARLLPAGDQPGGSPPQPSTPSARSPGQRQLSASPSRSSVGPRREAAPSASPGASPTSSGAAGEEALAPAKPKKIKVTFNATHCSYDVITDAVEERGWKVVRSENKAPSCNIHWIDQCGISEWFRRVEPWMKINHFPGMHNALARKTCLARNMARLQRLFPVEYSFLPSTWIIPNDIAEFERQFDETGKAKCIFIAKPDAGTQGRGIFLTNELAKIKQAANDRDTGLLVVQRYIGRPLLIDGLKFDLRLYLLVAGKLDGEGNLHPRLFLFRDGLVRLCTTEYVAPTPDNLDQKRMHLTNYAINKKSKDFVQNDGDDDGCGSKRSLRWFLESIAEEHGDKERDKLWNKLKGLCVKMTLATWPTFEAEYKNSFPKDLSGGAMGCRCFEVLGVDVMLDVKRRPYLIEVNHLPSFTCDSQLDQDIKSRVIQQTLDMVCRLDGGDKAAYEAAVAAKRRGDPNCVVKDDGESVLDSLSYKDYERAYPAPPEAPKAAARFEAIRAKVSEACRPLVVSAVAGAGAGAGQRPASSSLERRPPTASGSSGGSSSSSARRSEASASTAAGSSSSSVALPPRPRPPPGAPGSRVRPPPPDRPQPGEAGARRSRSAPVNPRRASPELPALPGSPGRGASPLETPRREKVRLRSLSREALRSAPPRPQLPQRQSLPMAQARIGLP